MADDTRSDDSPAKRPRRTDHDDEPTPRPPRKRRHTPSTTDSQSSHSHSVRRLNDTLLAQDPIVARDFAHDQLPPALKAMVRRISAFKCGRAVLADSLKPELADEYDDFHFEDASKRAALGPVPPLDAVRKIVELAHDCSNGDHCEAEWNGRVHTAVLDLALYNPSFKQRTRFMNCNSAQIEPRSLVPSLRASEKMRSKMVDFVLCLRPNPAEIDCMRRVVLESRSEALSINQTTHAPLIAAPIALSIETKRPGQDWDAAQLQLGVWVASQLNRLEQLVQYSWKEEWRNHVPEFLPLIVVQGHEWNFLAATRDTSSQTVLWRKIMFGDTMTDLGVYQIVATLQYLAQWAQSTYRSWFYESVLCMPVAT
ncbi:hypothetical protein SLS58_010764 [Diplodia intermedia]|uniref:PD-(D/E)XK nuclease-like domain-containing protein n=1 Tax=Diplodia intermedia TaxID=856260 RepID=A0ABR3T403_9PEZI